MGLGDYSKRFLAVLLDAFPEFKEHIAEGQDEGCFEVKFFAPSNVVFRVGTESLIADRITISFDLYHCHSGGWDGSIDEKDFEDAIQYIRRLICGEYQIAIWLRNGTYILGETIEHDKPVEPRFGRNGEELTLTIKAWNLSD
ncbi:hypothetical protein [Armatimonas sp.]|uniref:hypothetical protein n=1 Tax=Armatimonas sp. TaxID=1872638 RepID=UPI00286AE5BA|nr:hypothetical protein [Armatimonas sp.]